MSFINEIDTNLEAFKLVYDPTKLLSLLYLKYGDIEDDYYLLYANQLVHNKPSHYNTIFKECQLKNINEEFLKRIYKFHEAKERIPILSDYYKNYHKFFCKPLFRNFYLYELIHVHEEYKAEIFYKNNYADDNSKNEPEEKELTIKNELSSLSSLSSLDNITNNRTIFTKRNRKIIDNNLDSKMCTLTLTLDSLKNNTNLGLISKRSLGDSFEKVVNNIVNYHMKHKEKKYKRNKKSKEKIRKNKDNKEKEQKILNYINFTSNIAKKKKKIIISQSSYKNINNKINKIKKSLNSISRKNSSYKSNQAIINKINKRKNKSHSKNNLFFSAKMDNNLFSRVSSNFEEFNINKPINIQYNNHKRNKSYNIINNQISTVNSNNNTINKNSNMSHINQHMSNFNNFSKLSEILNKNKIKKNYNKSCSSQNTMKTSLVHNNKISLNNNNLFNNMDQFLTVNNEQINTNVVNMKRKKNKTFDYNIMNNNNNNANSTKNITSSNKLSPNSTGMNSNKNTRLKIMANQLQRKSSYGGSKFNLMKGSINNMSKNQNMNNNQKQNKNILNRLSGNYTSNFNHYKCNSKKFNNNSKKNLFSNASNSIPKFNLMSSKGEIILINNNINRTNNNV